MTSPATGRDTAAAPARPSLLAAPVSGYPAAEIAQILGEVLEEVIVRRQRAGFNPALIADLRTQVATIRLAAQQWREWRVSAGGSTEVVAAGTAPRSPQEITPEQAGALLGVSPSRVRQLLRAGAIEGRKTGRQWLTTRGEVETYRCGRMAGSD
ncbi:helix-turn-helix domain-containing protein [Actinomadura sp. NTSP31]|uniref:helix-turn-helix domain-containing protein n=1 Tax=Actinomadura sp. NTSP31 TaxID=1735447 RepID=UPI0035BFD689